MALEEISGNGTSRRDEFEVPTDTEGGCSDCNRDAILELAR